MNLHVLTIKVSTTLSVPVTCSCIRTLACICSFLNSPHAFGIHKSPLWYRYGQLWLINYLDAKFRFEWSGFEFLPCHCIVVSQCLSLLRVGTDKFNVGGNLTINKHPIQGKKKYSQNPLIRKTKGADLSILIIEVAAEPLSEFWFHWGKVYILNIEWSILWRFERRGLTVPLSRVMLQKPG